MTAEIIYKICAKQDWQAAEAAGTYKGAPVDRQDGFIHFSAGPQISETLRRHFAGERNLVLVAVDVTALGEALRWERSRGGELFPHLYGSLPIKAAIWTKPLPLSADGTHTLPALEGQT